MDWTNERWRRVNWYCLYTRSRHEKLVHEALTGKGLEVYLPLQQKWSRRGRQTRMVEMPVFPSYLFVRCPLTKENWLLIMKTPGLVRVLGTAEEPTPVPDEQVESLKIVLSKTSEVEGHPYLTVGDRVRVVQGPFKGAVGRLVEIARNRHKLVLAVDLMRKAVSVTINASDVVRLWPWE